MLKVPLGAMMPDGSRENDSGAGSMLDISTLSAEKEFFDGIFSRASRHPGISGKKSKITPHR